MQNEESTTGETSEAGSRQKSENGTRAEAESSEDRLSAPPKRGETQAVKGEHTSVSASDLPTDGAPSPGDGHETSTRSAARQAYDRGDFATARRLISEDDAETDLRSALRFDPIVLLVAGVLALTWFILFSLNL